MTLITKLGKYISILILITFLCGIIWTIYQYWSITNVGERAKPQKADVIIVLGAAVWEHGPSPALQARIKKSYEVYQQGYADKLILSGGLGTYPPAEAEVMAYLLTELGVDSPHLYLEDRSTNTRENLAFSKAIMDQHGWKSAIIVTDQFHMKRALKMAKDNGMIAYGAPVTETPLYTNKSLRFKYTLREVAALLQYYLEKYLLR